MSVCTFSPTSLPADMLTRHNANLKKEMLSGSTLRSAHPHGNLHHVANDQKHLILADGKLFVFGMDPNEKTVVKCDVCCTSMTHAGLRAWHKDFHQFCHDHAHCCHPLWCFRADHGGEWGFACGGDPADDLPTCMLLAITCMLHTIYRAMSRPNMFPKNATPNLDFEWGGCWRTCATHDRRTVFSDERMPCLGGS